MLLDVLGEEKAYILEQTERVQAGLNLYIYLRLREQALFKHGKISITVLSSDAKWLSDTVHKKYLEPLGHVVQSGFTSV